MRLTKALGLFGGGGCLLSVSRYMSERLQTPVEALWARVGYAGEPLPPSITRAFALASILILNILPPEIGMEWAQDPNHLVKDKQVLS